MNPASAELLEPLAGARALVERLGPVGVEPVALADASGRVLAEDARARA